MLTYMYTRDYDEKNDTLTIADEEKEATETVDAVDNPVAAPQDENNGEIPAPAPDDTEMAQYCMDDADDQDDSIAYNNLAIYLVAEKYGIRTLKALALKRFTTWLNNHDPTETLAELIRETMLLLPPYDYDLRNSLSKYLAGNPETMSLHGMYAVMAEFGSLAAGVLESVLKERAQMVKEERSLTTRLDSKETEIDILKREFTSANAELISKLKCLSSCRNCGENFNVTLDDNWQSTGKIRCKQCNTRH